MGEAPNSPAAIRFAQHIADCPSLFPEVTHHLCLSDSLQHKKKRRDLMPFLFKLVCSYKQILKTLFEIVLFEDCGNQWSLSRPMLSLILISEQVMSFIIQFPTWGAFVNSSNLTYKSNQIFSDLKAKILSSQVIIQNSLLFSYMSVSFM